MKARASPWHDVDDGVMNRWFALEMGNLHKGLVTAGRPLADLVREEAPTARTRSGEPHRFDKDVLTRFHEALSPLDRRRLRVPITFHVDKDYAGDAVLQDEVAARLLHALGDLPPGRVVREGKLWMSHAQAQALARRYPSVFQFVFL